MILDHFTSAPLMLDRARTYTQEGPFKPNGLWVSVRGDDDWESWCRSENYGDPDNQIRHTVALADTANITNLTTPADIEKFYNQWRIPDGRNRDFQELRPDYINWAAFTKTCDGIIIAPYQWSMRLGHMWYYGWDCASGCIWNLDAIATIEPADTDRSSLTPSETLETVLRERLTGRRVLEAKGDALRLDDGTVLHLFMSESDCCASAAGEWVLKPELLDAMITDVQAVPDEERSGDDGGGTTNYLTIKILHNQNPIAMADCYANNGNGGYYYSCLSLNVSNVIDTTGKHTINLKVVDA